MDIDYTEIVNNLTIEKAGPKNFKEDDKYVATTEYKSDTYFIVYTQNRSKQFDDGDISVIIASMADYIKEEIRNKENGA